MKSDDWDRRYQASNLIWGAEPNRFLVAEVGDLAAGRALDLACGEGRNAVWLAGRGWRVMAVDFSAVALEKARSLAGERHVEVDWVQADLLDYTPEPDAFDLVIVFYLQVPASERRRVMGSAARAVAPGGTLLVVGHDLLNLSEGFGGPQDPTLLFTPDDIEHDVNGLRIERAEQVRRPVEADGLQLEAIDALVRAMKPLREIAGTSRNAHR
jgi:SAM-dependent methyltransferase